LSGHAHAEIRGQYLDPDAGRITFRKYAEECLANRTTEPTTRERIETRLRVHVYPVLGPKMLAQIKPSTIQSWLAGLSGAASTRRLALGTVSAILSAAVDDERIAKNPCKAGSVSPPKREAAKVIPWTVEQVAAVRLALSGPLPGRARTRRRTRAPPRGDLRTLSR